MLAIPCSRLGGESNICIRGIIHTCLYIHAHISTCKQLYVLGPHPKSRNTLPWQPKLLYPFMVMGLRFLLNEM